MTQPYGQQPQPGQQPPPAVYVNVHQNAQQSMQVGGRSRVRWTFGETMLVVFTAGLAWPYVWMRHRRIRRAHRRW
ncbi:hypothetical protein ACLQ2R_17225 [Streptosporangium sp. DT93]|uniref:hypothetical protein n=1 Tax=Streptosporangium sp. DT93 TaxID=3393428 RepID=UPI003CEFEEE4